MERRGEGFGTLFVFLLLAALYVTVNSGSTIVLLLLPGYSLVTQLLPALLFSLLPNTFVTKWGAAAGIIAGVATVTYVIVAGISLRGLFPSLGSLGDTNIGIVALLVNVIVLVAVSLATRGVAVTSKEQSA